MMISQQKRRARLKFSVFGSGFFLVPSVLILGLLPAPALGQEVAESLLSVSAYEEPQGEEIREILVEGTQRIDDAAVASYLTLGVGDLATSDKMKTSLKALFATGLFADLNLAVQEGTLIVQVVENPIVSSVSFEGMDMINEDDLEKEVQLKPRFVYTLPKIQKDVQRILDLYRRSGRFAAMVDPQVVSLEQNRVDVVFKIVEGKHTGVRRIQFIGNEQFDDDVLRGQTHTQESAWWKFFTSSDFYDPDRVSYDRELLRRFYANEGYVDFRVISSVAEMTPDRSDFFLTFTLEEGSRYKFRKIAVESEIKGLEGETLNPELLTLPDTWYNGAKIENTVAKLTAILGDRQYAFVDIVPEVKKDKELEIVDLTYHIKPGERVHIGRIDITGNTRTIDKVIRREILVAEGDPFSISKIKRSEQKIKDLGYFEIVKVTPFQGVQTDRSDIKIEVKEKATGDISLGAGFSSTDGLLGDFSIRERNFLGKGQDVRLGATLSGITKQFDFSFTEPYFLDRDLSAGIDLFHIRTDQQEESNYDEVTTGFSFRLGYPLSEALRQVVSYTLRRDEISDISSTASRFVRNQEGESTSSFVSQELVYDKRNSRLEPTEGYITKLKTDLAGLGGNSRYYRIRLSGSQYYELMDDVVLAGTAEVGYVDGFDQPVRINDRFFLGGNTLRGFAYGGVGPRDLTGDADDALGGTRFVRSSVEISSPTFLPEDLGFLGHFFVDAAILSHSDEDPLSSELFRDDENIRASVGVGLSWASPFGPVRLDYALPFMKQPYDKTEQIHFSFGTRF